MSSNSPHFEKEWSLILGSSSGFGEALSLELASKGMNIFGVHLDRKNTLPHVEEIVQTIQSKGRQALFFNVNAADPLKRKEVLDAVQQKLNASAIPSVKVFFHSLAFGTLKPYIASDPHEAMTQPQMEMTVDVMAHSLVYWVQDLVQRRLLGKGSRIFAMTSSGGTRVWPTYGAVSAAKATLESHMRQLALELAPFGITANCVRAGVTDTPALRKIPGNEKMIQIALDRNPSGRMTTPKDVAQAIGTFCLEESHWMTGNVIGVDGGEDIVG
ncbi:MAG: SDR family oxidoreductase [Candidatus Omnitrophica bacterium]|nr:SDR family oxidoreductase [Candidatus Omnitrophota bacterium]